ncbi:hypothetical protein [Myceligenerans salitolerans]|uniref:Small CPxCG-related zinc finger protein n=1 Tax=Myceligenerans salitolerans TaxID=1230528 RepID=A0ABS3I8E4_9MICO|nr:hypothetical protein [Myceligenerans salitolerans]MBO0609262.1 hypothetical protein [Myceligenerans salitolerans]
MDQERWNDIVESGRQGDCGPWLCFDCDDLTVEQGVRFGDDAAVEITYMCNSCVASITVPA